MKKRRNPGEGAAILTLAAVGGIGYLLAQNGTLGSAAQHFVAGLAGPSGAAAGSVPPGTGASGTYNTVNGAKTLAQMYSELKVAGWGGASTDTAGIVAAYASTTKGAVTGPN